MEYKLTQREFERRLALGFVILATFVFYVIIIGVGISAAFSFFGESVKKGMLVGVITLIALVFWTRIVFYLFRRLKKN